MMSSTCESKNAGENTSTSANANTHIVDFHLLSVPDANNKEGNDTLLLLRTNNNRQKTSDEALCAICYYNSEDDEDDEEQEKQIAKRSMYDTHRYAQMYVTTLGNCDNSEAKTECVCSHRFHTVCLYKWVKSSREFKCPLCRATPLEDHTKMNTVPELFGSEPEYIIQYYPNGKVKSECYKENGMLHKFFKTYDLIGNITYECGYFKGDKHGDEIEYHIHTNKKWKIQQYKFGTKHGYYKEYSLVETGDRSEDEDGRCDQILLKHQEWQNGMLHGTEQEWFLAGQSRKRYCEYHEGAKHGTEKIWTIDGKLIFYKKYDHGRSVGRCVVRFPDNGCLERKCFYNRHGQLDGIYLEWQYACKSLTKSSSKNNKTNGSGSGGALNMNLIGMLTGGALNFGGGNNESEEEVDQYSTTEAVLKINAHYIDGARVGDYLEYHDNGTLKIRAHYNFDGEYDGEYFEYDRFGRCTLRYLYEDGKLQGVCERYKNGKMSECGYYNDDVLDGVGCYRQYYTNGKLKKKQSYYRGLPHGDELFYNQKGQIMKRFKYDRNNLIS